MAGERTYAILPCPDLEEALAFYAALGFALTYRQHRPNPYAVVGLEDIVIHLAGIDGFDPRKSVSSVIVTVPDADALHVAFETGLRTRYGRVPVAGIPRLLRPRRKAGTATGFSLVDPGGNWVRVYRAGEAEEEPGQRRSGLARTIDVAARQGDARGEDAEALGILDRGLARHADAPSEVRAEAAAYRDELLARLGRGSDARPPDD
ncbi:MAG: hypothetical protein ACRCYR_00500 [Phycicoccus sp.]